MNIFMVNKMQDLNNHEEMILKYLRPFNLH